MSHDIDDLLQLVKQLELRIIELEKLLIAQSVAISDDSWYWDH